MSPQQKRQDIRERLTQARQELNHARQELSGFDEALKRNEGLPAPDGSVALRNANLRFRFAHEHFRQVLDEFTAAVLRGKT